VHVTLLRKFHSPVLVLGEATIDHAGPVGASGKLDAGAAALPFNASKTPTEPKAKATKMRGLKTPD
jgi:hypothetical protein